jgi:hypothetical protein
LDRRPGKIANAVLLKLIESIAAAILGALHVETKHMEISAPWFKTKGC